MDANEVYDNDGMISQLAQSSDWNDAGMDDEKRGSKNDEKEREVQSNTSEDIDEGKGDTRM